METATTTNNRAFQPRKEATMAFEFNYLTAGERRTVVISGASVDAIWNTFDARFGRTQVLYTRDLGTQEPMVVLG
jgi:hypothetical protein